MTAFFNIAIRQGQTERIPITKHHGVTAIAPPSSTTLKVVALTTAIASGTTLEFPSGTATLTADAAIAAKEITVSFTGKIQARDRAKGPAYDFTGLSWRGKAKNHLGSEVLTLDFDTSSAAEGSITVVVSATAATAIPANVRIDEWQSIRDRFFVAREMCDFTKLERFIAKANPWYTFDIESFSGSPEIVDRQFEGRLVCIAEQTT